MFVHTYRNNLSNGPRGALLVLSRPYRGNAGHRGGSTRLPFLKSTRQIWIAAPRSRCEWAQGTGKPNVRIANEAPCIFWVRSVRWTELLASASCPPRHPLNSMLELRGWDSWEFLQCWFFTLKFSDDVKLQLHHFTMFTYYNVQSLKRWTVWNNIKDMPGVTKVWPTDFFIHKEGTFTVTEKQLYIFPTICNTYSITKMIFRSKILGRHS